MLWRYAVSPSKTTWRSYRILASQEPVGFLLRKNLSKRSKPLFAAFVTGLLQRLPRCSAVYCFAVLQLNRLAMTGNLPYCHREETFAVEIRSISQQNDVAILQASCFARTCGLLASQEPVGFLLRKNLWASCFARTFQKGASPFLPHPEVDFSQDCHVAKLAFALQNLSLPASQ